MKRERERDRERERERESEIHPRQISDRNDKEEKVS